MIRNRKSPNYYNDSLTLLMGSILINKKTSCWEFIGKRNRDGYGSFSYLESNNLAHRSSWHLFNGAIPERLSVCHTCDNPPCVNPDHLFLGTHKQNMEDSARKGRRKGKPANNRKFSIKQIKEITDSYLCGETTPKIAARFESHRNTIWGIVTKRTYKNI